MSDLFDNLYSVMSSLSIGWTTSRLTIDIWVCPEVLQGHVVREDIVFYLKQAEAKNNNTFNFGLFIYCFWLY